MFRHQDSEVVELFMNDDEVWFILSRQVLYYTIWLIPTGFLLQDKGEYNACNWTNRYRPPGTGFDWFLDKFSLVI